MRHLISTLSLTVITLDLFLWSVVLVVIALLQWLVPGRAFRSMLNTVVERLYRFAVAFDSFWITRVLGIQIDVFGKVPTNRAEKLVVISNHASWFDVFLIQHVITGKGPIIKFLVKRELLYLPVIGWICFALRFPRLERTGSRNNARERDYQSIAMASKDVAENPGAILNFAEGTRFAEAKRQAQVSRYKNLLNPKSGGLRIMLASLPGARLVDVTIAYPAGASFWRCLSGAVRRVEVHLDWFVPAELGDVNDWLGARWAHKDSIIESMHHTEAHLP